MRAIILSPPKEKKIYTRTEEIDATKLQTALVDFRTEFDKGFITVKNNTLQKFEKDVNDLTDKLDALGQALEQADMDIQGLDDRINDLLNDRARVTSQISTMNHHRSLVERIRDLTKLESEVC